MVGKAAACRRLATSLAWMLMCPGMRDRERLHAMLMCMGSLPTHSPHLWPGRLTIAPGALKSADLGGSGWPLASLNVTLSGARPLAVWWYSS
jgi:hypothetical protein